MLGDAQEPKNIFFLISFHWSIQSNDSWSVNRSCTIKSFHPHWSQLGAKLEVQPAQNNMGHTMLKIWGIIHPESWTFWLHVPLSSFHRNDKGSASDGVCPFIRKPTVFFFRALAWDWTKRVKQNQNNELKDTVKITWAWGEMQSLVIITWVTQSHLASC